MDAECRVYRRILLKEYDKGVFLHENHKKVDLNKVCAFMVEAHIDCAPVLTMLYRYIELLQLLGMPQLASNAYFQH